MALLVDQVVETDVALQTSRQKNAPP